MLSRLLGNGAKERRAPLKRRMDVEHDRKRCELFAPSIVVERGEGNPAVQVRPIRTRRARGGDVVQGRYHAGRDLFGLELERDVGDRMACPGRVDRTLNGERALSASASADEDVDARFEPTAKASVQRLEWCRDDLPLPGFPVRDPLLHALDGDADRHSRVRRLECGGDRLARCFRRVGDRLRRVRVHLAGSDVVRRCFKSADRREDPASCFVALALLFVRVAHRVASLELVSLVVGG